jgi:hypothetical protein
LRHPNNLLSNLVRNIAGIRGKWRLVVNESDGGGSAFKVVASAGVSRSPGPGLSFCKHNVAAIVVDAPLQPQSGVLRPLD